MQFISNYVIAIVWLCTAYSILIVFMKHADRAVEILHLLHQPCLPERGESMNHIIIYVRGVGW